MKRERIDKVLSALDNPTQKSMEHGYSGAPPWAHCWRCQGSPGDGASGVCDACRAVLLSEVEPESEAVTVADRYMVSVDRLLSHAPSRPLYWDREGNPLDTLEWGRLFERFDDYRLIDETEIGDVRVSTVWLGLNQNVWGDGPPLIFETMIFGGEHDSNQYRTSTETQARAAHDWACQLVRGEVSEENDDE